MKNFQYAITLTCFRAQYQLANLVYGFVYPVRERISCLRVKRFTFSQTIGYKLTQFFSFPVGKQWAFIGVRCFQALSQFGRGKFEVNCQTLCIHIFHIVEKARSTAAGRDNYIIKFSYFMQASLFEQSELLFSNFRKNLRYGIEMFFFNVCIHVYETISKLLSHQFANSGFARTHVTNQKNSFHPCNNLLVFVSNTYVLNLLQAKIVINYQG